MNWLSEYTCVTEWREGMCSGSEATMIYGEKSTKYLLPMEKHQVSSFILLHPLLDLLLCCFHYVLQDMLWGFGLMLICTLQIPLGKR